VARFVSSPETFLVEEIPAYLPAGSGEHTFLWIEKRELTTWDAVNTLARRLRVEARDIGCAGLKDKHAITRQWLSVPRVTPEVALAAGDEQLQVLQAIPHGNKLRTGHLRGNRFEVVLTDLEPGEGQRLVESLAALAHQGLPNRYGEQRFGRDGDNVARGIALLRGQQRERDARRRRLWLSSVQSAVFNEVLRARTEAGSLRQVLTGDVLQKAPAGGVFVTEDPAQDQPRLDAGEVVTTGPMPGGWAKEPPPHTTARAIEDAALAAVGVTATDFASERDLPGTRRPLLVPVSLPAPGEPPAHDAVSLRIAFELPAGTYATVLVNALGVTVGQPRAPMDESMLTSNANRE
jgi:tRNA pseudouridine13 synthase